MIHIPGDADRGDGNPSGVGFIAGEIWRVEECGHRRSARHVWNPKFKGAVQSGDEHPALAVLDFTPFGVGFQDRRENVIAEPLQMCDDNLTGEARDERRNVLENDGGWHPVADQR